MQRDRRMFVLSAFCSSWNRFFFTIIEFYFVFLALSLIHVTVLKGSSSRSGISYYQTECSHSANLLIDRWLQLFWDLACKPHQWVAGCQTEGLTQLWRRLHLWVIFHEGKIILNSLRPLTIKYNGSLFALSSVCHWHKILLETDSEWCRAVILYPLWHMGLELSTTPSLNKMCVCIIPYTWFFW